MEEAKLDKSTWFLTWP